MFFGCVAKPDFALQQKSIYSITSTALVLPVWALVVSIFPIVGA